MSPVDLLLSQLPDAQPSGNGLLATCPAHDDERRSLSISEGKDGRALIHCHAGCTPEEICEALGLSTADLFPASTSTVSPALPHNGQYRRCNNGTSPDRKFAAVGEAVSELERLLGPRSDLWTYHDAHGEPVGVVVRWDRADGKKDIRPVSRYDDGWRIGGMPEPRVLYGLPEVVNADRVYVCEGEKAADAARSIDLTATTSAHGSSAAHNTDWTPLAGKEIVILPDNDQAGLKYADTVAALLEDLTPAPVVKVVELPDLPDRGDIVDWIDAHGEAAEPDELRRQIEELVEAASIWSPVATTEPWPEPTAFDDSNLADFPTQSLPTPLRCWVDEESHATQTPPDLAALLSLAVCSAAIARRIEAEPHPGWHEPVNLFVAILLEPGNRKSAVFTDTTHPLRELEAELIKAAEPDVARRQSDRRQKKEQLKRFEKLAVDKHGEEASHARHEADQLAAELAGQAEPVLPRLIVDDATAEKLGMMLAEQGGRLASMSPEGGVFDLMAGLYSKSGIPQFGVYLMGHSGDDLITDRVNRQGVRVTRPALTAAYAVQPDVIKGLAARSAFRGRGLLGRFLYAAPKSRIGQREVAPTPVSSATRENYRGAVRKLADLDGDRTLRLSSDATALFLDWQTKVEEMLADGGAMEAMRDWGAKLAGATIRIAAVLHLMECPTTDEIGVSVLAAAIEIARYLIPHADRVLNMMCATDGTRDDDARYLLRWIKRHGRREFSKRDAQQHGKRRFPRADDIDPALDELERRGYIRKRPKETTKLGRPPSPCYDVNPAVFDNQSPERRPQNSQISVPDEVDGVSESIERASTFGEVEPARQAESPAEGWGEV